MKKMILAAIVLLLADMTAFAYDFIENGFAYTILKDGTLSLSNKVKDFKLDKEMDQSLTYKGDVTVPASVTHAGKKYIVSTIGTYAFYDCRSLNSVKISEGISKIDLDAFYYCSMRSLTIPASVSKLTPGCFHQCAKLATITVSPQNRYYKSEGNCIYNKAMTQLVFVSPVLKLYKFPASVTSVADYAFNASTIKRLTIPKTLTHIGGLAFYSNDIKEITGKRPLKKLAGSADYMPGCPLPIWALSMTAAKAVNVEAAMKALGSRKDNFIPNVYPSRVDEHTVVMSNSKGTVSFNAKVFAGKYKPDTKTKIECEVSEFKDYPNPEPGYGCLVSQQKIDLLCVNGFIDE